MAIFNEYLAISKILPIRCKSLFYRHFKRFFFFSKLAIPSKTAGQKKLRKLICFRIFAAFIVKSLTFPKLAPSWNFFWLASGAGKPACGRGWMTESPDQAELRQSAHPFVEHQHCRSSEVEHCVSCQWGLSIQLEPYRHNSLYPHSYVADSNNPRCWGDSRSCRAWPERNLQHQVRNNPVLNRCHGGSPALRFAGAGNGRSKQGLCKHHSPKLLMETANA